MKLTNVEMFPVPFQNITEAVCHLARPAQMKGEMELSWEAALTQGGYLSDENPNPTSSLKSASDYTE